MRLGNRNKDRCEETERKYEFEESRIGHMTSELGYFIRRKIADAPICMSRTADRDRKSNIDVVGKDSKVEEVLVVVLKTYTCRTELW